MTAGAAGNADPRAPGRHARGALRRWAMPAASWAPLVIGWTLDLAGGMSPMAWGLAFAIVGLLMLVALVVFLILRPANLAGDRRS